MFDNIGSKIKMLAFVLTCVGFFASVIIGFMYMPAGIIIIPAGCLLSWVICLPLYGFGQLIENTDKLVSKLTPGDEPSAENVILKSETGR